MSSSRHPCDNGATGPDRVANPDTHGHERTPGSGTRPWRWPPLLAVAIGGVLGAEARYGIGLAMPTGAHGFPWATALVNVTGCAAIGVVMTLLTYTRPRRLLRPLIVTGVLGGYTTFSTFTVEAARLAREQHLAAALGYIAMTVVLCLVATYTTMRATRIVLEMTGRREAVREARR